VTVRGAHRLGVTLKLLASALLLGLLAAESVLPPLALAAVLPVVLAIVIAAERPLTAQTRPSEAR
jgi:hypothetical protein